MAYGSLPTNFASMNGSQQNDAAIAAGYTGLEDFNNQKSRGIAGGGGGADIADDSFDLESIYKQKYEESGITAEEQALATKTSEAAALKKSLAEAETFIGDNPFISEAKRVGRVNRRRIEADTKLGIIQGEANSIQGRIDRKKADVETALNLKLKQFDINNQKSQQALSKFNTLLSSGLLTNASDADIANITRSTGISSDMISGAISLARQKNVEPQLVTSTDDDGNLTIVAVDKATGNILSQNSVAGVGKAKTGGGGGTEAEKKAYYMDSLRKDAASGQNLSTIFSIYSGLIDPNDIYTLYNANSKFGPDKGNIKNLKKYGVK